MTLLTAMILFAAAVIGIILTRKFVRKNRALRIISIVLLSLIALVLACYIGLSFILIDAIQHQPPTP
ncbi:MAG: hypothetical protein ACI4XJ_11085 [Eubacteriales bacterium]